MSNLSITERRNDSITILDLHGKIMLGGGCNELRDAVRSLMERGQKKILLNMADVSHIDSSGLGELVSGFTHFEKNAGEMKLFNLSDRVHGLMTMTKLLTIFDIYENEAQAIESFNNPPPAKPATTANA